jgi:hypothetical protein
MKQSHWQVAFANLIFVALSNVNSKGGPTEIQNQRQQRRSPSLVTFVIRISFILDKILAAFLIM